MISNQQLLLALFTVLLVCLPTGARAFDPLEVFSTFMLGFFGLLAFCAVTGYYARKSGRLAKFG